jgi:hypothetical protein
VVFHGKVGLNWLVVKLVCVQNHIKAKKSGVKSERLVDWFLTHDFMDLSSKYCNDSQGDQQQVS